MNPFDPFGFGGPTGFDGGLDGMANDQWLFDLVTGKHVQKTVETDSDELEDDYVEEEDE